MDQFIKRLLGAAKLDVATYEALEHDKQAMASAVWVVVLVAVATGIGGAGHGGLVIGIIGSLVGWVLWAAVIYFIGAKLLPEENTEADMGQVLRTLAFAQAPGLLRVFGFIPVLGPLIGLVSAIWMIVAMVIAVRQSLDYASTGRALGVVLLGFVFYMAVFAVLFALGGGPR